MPTAWTKHDRFLGTHKDSPCAKGHCRVLAVFRHTCLHCVALSKRQFQRVRWACFISFFASKIRIEIKTFVNFKNRWYCTNFRVYRSRNPVLFSSVVWSCNHGSKLYLWICIENELRKHWVDWFDDNPNEPLATLFQNLTHVRDILNKTLPP